MFKLNIFNDEKILNKKFKIFIQKLIAYLRVIYFSTIVFSWEFLFCQLDMMQYLFQKLNHLIDFIIKLHPVVALITADFQRKYYFLLIEKYNLLIEFIYKNGNSEISAVEKESQRELFKKNIDIFKISFYDNYLHFLVYSKNIWCSLINVSMLKYYEFIFKEFFVNDEKYIDFKKQIDLREEGIYTTPFIISNFLAIGFCKDIDKIENYSSIDSETIMQIREINNELEKCKITFKEINQKNLYKYNEEIADYLLDIDGLKNYLMTFKNRNVNQKNNLLQIIIMFYKSFNKSDLKLLYKKELDELEENILSCLNTLEKKNLLFKNTNKIFDNQENFYYNSSLSSENKIKYEKKMNCLEKNVFIIKSLLNPKTKTLKMPGLDIYIDNFKKDTYEEFSINKIKSKNNKIFTFDLYYGDLIKNFMLEVHHEILDLFTENSQNIKNYFLQFKEKLKNSKANNDDKIKTIFDLLSFENYNILNVDILRELQFMKNEAKRKKINMRIKFLQINSFLIDKFITVKKTNEKDFHRFDFKTIFDNIANYNRNEIPNNMQKALYLLK